MIAVSILNYNDFDTTERLIDSIVNYKSISQIVVVDNKSTDDSYEKLKDRYSDNDKIILIETGVNGGYGYGNNCALQYIATNLKIDHVLICNPDVFFSEETIKDLEQVMETREDAIIVAPLMLDINKKVQYKCVWRLPSAVQSAAFSSLILSKLVSTFYYDTDYFASSNIIEVDCVAGSMLLLDISKFEEPRIYDENVFLFCEETILGVIAKRLKFKSYLSQNSTFIHAHSVSINKAYPKQIQHYKMMWKSRIYMIKKYLAKNRLEIAFAYFARFITLTEKRLILLKRKAKGTLNT